MATSVATPMLTAAIVVATSAAMGQTYPSKPVRIVTSGAGGGTDFAARLIAQGLADSLGQQIIVDNRGGIGYPEIVAKASADGYTLLVDGTGFWTAPLLRETPFNPIRDYAPVVLVTSAPSILVVHPSVPVKSVQELIALAKAKPGALNYASTGTGGTTHLAGELLKSMAGINIVHVPYKGSGAATVATLGNETQMQISGAATVLGHVKAGKLRGLAVTSTEPSPLVPGFPTVASAGLPGYEALPLQGLFAPAKTPRPIVMQLNQDVGRYIQRSDVKEKLANAGSEAVGGTPEQFGARVKAEIARWGKVIREAGIRAD